MKGSVYKRCTCGITGGSPSRPPACKKSHGAWYYVADLEPDRTGKRRQERKGGFRAADEANAALAHVLAGIATGTHAHDERKTVAVFLDEWLSTEGRRRLAPDDRAQLPAAHRRLPDSRLRSAAAARPPPWPCSAWLTNSLRSLTRPDRPRGDACMPRCAQRCRARCGCSWSRSMRRPTSTCRPRSRPKVRPWEAGGARRFPRLAAADPLDRCSS